MSKKIKNLEKDPLYVGKILAMFLDEIELPERIKKKRKNKKKKKKQDNYDDIKENKPEKNEEDKKDGIIIINSDIVEKVEIKKNVSFEQNEIIEYKNEELVDKNLDFRNYINKLLNLILNKSIMGNIDIKNELGEIKKIIFDLADKNVEIEEKLKDLNEEVKKLKDSQENNKELKDLREDVKQNNKELKDLKEQVKEYNKVVTKLNNENNQIKMKIKGLNDENEELREIIGEIQCRDLSKNFLMFVRDYLIEKHMDVSHIHKELRGAEYSKKIGDLFSNANKLKLSIVQNLISYSSEVSNEGDYYAHVLSLKNYRNYIEHYKYKIKLDTIKNNQIFCFLIALGIDDKDLEESFNFLCQFFNKALTVRNKDIDVFKTYFK